VVPFLAPLRSTSTTHWLTRGGHDENGRLHTKRYPCAKDKLEETEAEKTRLEQLRIKLLRLREQSKEQVCLTVGGQSFQASRATLTEGDAADSMFAALFSDRWNSDSTPNSDNTNGAGGVFIDRSPVLFAYVLQWLRSGSAECLPDTADLRRGLLREAEYFSLAGLVDVLKGWRHRELSLSAENLEILQIENGIRAKLAAFPDSDGAFDNHELVPADVRSLQTLADSLMIDVFDVKDSFVLDIAPPKDTENLTIFVDKRAAADTRVKAAAAILELGETNPMSLKKTSVCDSLSMFKDCNFRYFTMDTLQGMDWTGVLLAGGAVLGALLPLPDDLHERCFPEGLDPEIEFVWNQVHNVHEDDFAADLVDHFHGGVCEGHLDYNLLSDADGTSYSLKFHPTFSGNSEEETSIFKSSDIDLFLYGLSKKQAERKIEHILAVLGNTVKHIIRSEHCISFIRGWPHRNVQVLNFLFCYLFI